ncbi:Plakophilin-4 [Halocaridina rubra]|uniref:Plakophilin-4 n=1 Tax=Halocaridina rubra TaxID=373956 RepID=A0AAN8XI97_HALRR
MLTVTPPQKIFLWNVSNNREEERRVDDFYGFIELCFSFDRYYQNYLIISFFCFCAAGCRVLEKDKTSKNISNAAQPEVTTTTTSYSVDYGPQTTTNGHPLNDSPNSSRLSVSSSGQDSSHLVSRKQTQHTTQQITTTTKVYRELHHIGPDGEVVEYPPEGEYDSYAPARPSHSQPGYAMDPYRPHSPASEAGSRSQYEGYPPTTNAGYEYDPYSRGAPPPSQEYPYGQVGYPPQNEAGYSGHYRDAAAGNYVDPGYLERPPTPPSPSERSESPPPHRTIHQGMHAFSLFLCLPSLTYLISDDDCDI